LPLLSIEPKISKANAGNVPWNFGRRRSGADKAKISVGVRARNRQRLLRQLEQLGMSEEEWLQWKKKISNLRDYVGRKRSENRKCNGNIYNARLKRYQENRYKELMNERQEAKVCRRCSPLCGSKKVSFVAHNVFSSKQEEEQKVELYKNLQQEEHDERIKTLFPKEITWRSFSFSDDQGLSSSYTEICPLLGPGGLICCETCSQKYSSYLTQTMEDLESQRIQREIEEVKEAMQLLEGSQKDLGKTLDSTTTGLLEAFGKVSGTRNGSRKLYYR
jgi:hypothetical protein